MKPVSIPERLRHTHEGFNTITIGPPPGTESKIGSVEAEVGVSSFGPTILILMRLDKADFAVLQENHGLFWFSILSEQLYPFAMHPVLPADAQQVDPSSMETNLFVDPQEGTIATPHDIAKAFHETHTKLTPQFGFTNDPQIPWEELPTAQQDLLLATVTDLFF